MTNAQKDALSGTFKVAVPIFMAIGTVIFSAGFARRELDFKEDRASHVADVRDIRDALQVEVNTRTLQQVRDSALMSVVLERLDDIACTQNPARRYCR
jgi:hypothetical protein